MIQIKYPRHTRGEIGGRILEAKNKEEQLIELPACWKEAACYAAFYLMAHAAFIMAALLSFLSLMPFLDGLLINNIQLNKTYQIYLIMIIYTIFLLLVAYRPFKNLLKWLVLKMNLPLLNEAAAQKRIYESLNPYYALIESIETIKPMLNDQIVESDFIVDECGLTLYVSKDGRLEKLFIPCDKETAWGICKPGIIDFSTIDKKIDKLLGSA